MSQRDCGCPGLVTPTLEQLLAVARSKPLPRVKVRERRPPPAKVGATLKGWMEWRLVDRRGREVRGGEGPNLILDQGLDLIATTPLKLLTASSDATIAFPIIRYAAVGTDSTAPDASQTGLGSEAARTGAVFANDAIARPGDGVYRLTKSFEFDYSQANGNLTEWGCSPESGSGSNLFNRALFTDSGGDPDTVTKTDQEKLRIIYTLEVSLSPVSFTAGSFTLTGVGAVTGNYTLVGWDSPGSLEAFRQPDLQVFSALARADINTVVPGLPLEARGSAIARGTDMSGVTYAQSFPAGTIANVARDVTDVRDEYTPGSFQRTGGSWRWDTAYGNLDPIRAFTISGNHTGADLGRPGYVFAIDSGSTFSKDDEHALTVGMPTVSWGRAS